jgi:RimJ/RimL family protein N-acetyltransferase
MLGPTLHGRLISLQPSEISDLTIFRSWFADLETTRFLLMRFVPSAKQEEEWFAQISSSPAHVQWKIVHEGRTIGTTALHDIDHLNSAASTGTLIGDRSLHGKGFGTEVVRLRTAYAFNELNLQRLETESLAENIPMHRCLEKSGYLKLGRRRRRIYRSGVWHDSFIFELLREDWERLQATDT